MEIFAGLSIVSLSGFSGVFMLKKSGLIFKSPMATASRMRDLIMAGQQRVYDIVLHMQWHFLSVLIRIHVIHPKFQTPQLVQLMNIVSNLIFHCNHCDAASGL